MYNDETEVTTGMKLAAVAVGAVLLLIIGLIGFSLLSTRVSASEVCVQTRFGKVHKVLTPGLHYSNAITMDTTCYTKRLRTYEVSLVSPSESNSKADYIDWTIGARTKDGIDFNSALSVQYRVGTDDIINSYTNGFRSMDDLNEKVIKYHVRNLVPQVLSKYTAEQLYLGDLNVASDELKELIAAEALKQGVTIENFELKRGDFDDSYEQAIRDKALKREEAKKKELEQEVATAEAERLRIEAEGQAAAARIQAQGEADATVTRANAQADAEAIVLQKRAEQIAAHPELITWQQIETIKSANIVYLPNEVLPIVDITEGTNKE